MSTLYFRQGVCNRHTHAGSAPGSVRGSVTFPHRGKTPPTCPFAVRILRASHLACESFHPGGVAGRD